MMAAATSTLEKFLDEILRIIHQNDGDQLQNYLVVEPPYAPLYQAMVSEIQAAYPKTNDEALEAKCDQKLAALKDLDDGSSWGAFIKFTVQYFVFLREVNTDNLLQTYNLLAELVQKCNSALTHASKGILMLPAAVNFSNMLSRLAIGLDKQPHLIAHLVQNRADGDDGGGRETLPERAANIIRQAFVTCLNDRSGHPSGLRNGRPEGKKVGIYKFANLCLKTLFQCGKERNAEQIFTNIYNQSPPLAAYPKAEQTKYLYYLGLFMFQNSHFYRAQLTLQRAYDLCHPKFLKQRRLCLIYLVTANMILGRFPSASLYARPEAQGFAERFQPICNSIKSGDLTTFSFLTSWDNPNSNWFYNFRIFLQIRSRCEILVWRSVMRKTFISKGDQGNAEARKAPTQKLDDVQAVIRAYLRRADNSQDPLVHNGCTGTYERPSMLEVESVMSSLITQGFLKGYLSHKSLRFAIQGAKGRNPVEVGFPNVWQIIKSRSDDEVPGWKKSSPSTGGGFGPGMVVNLSGARAAGSSG